MTSSSYRSRKSCRKRSLVGYPAGVTYLNRADVPLQALLALKAAGKVGFIGITGLPLAHLQRILQAVPPGTVDVVLSYCKLSLADASLLPAAAALRGCGPPGPPAQEGPLPNRGLISASPLAMGLLTARGPPVWHPAPLELRAACEAASVACDARGLALALLALQWAVRRPEVDTTLVGMATCAEVCANCDAARAALEPGWDARVAGALVEVQACLAAVVGTTWRSGLDENETAP